MATENVKIVNSGSGNVTPTIICIGEAAATAILLGQPVKAKSVGSNYVIPLADAEPLIGTTTRVVGIAKADSTQTASANGDFEVYDAANSATIYRCHAKSSTAANTQAKIDALLGSYVMFDLTSSVYTIETGATANANGLVIVGGNPDTNEIFFQIRPAAIEGVIA